jgi:hypothetical protein
MRALVLVAVLACCGCGSMNEPQHQQQAQRQAGPELPPALEEELDKIRADPAGAVGYGRKAFMPYGVGVAHFLVSYDDSAVTKRLLAEMQGADRVLKLALLHVLGMRSDPTVDAALRDTLRDPELTATSAYLLAREGYKGYADRPVDVDADRAALRDRLDDDTLFDDPFYHRGFRTQDFILAAFIRLTGPDRFTFPDPDLEPLIGYELPRFDDATRAELLEQARRTD